VEGVSKVIIAASNRYLLLLLHPAVGLSPRACMREKGCPVADALHLVGGSQLRLTTGNVSVPLQMAGALLLSALVPFRSGPRGDTVLPFSRRLMRLGSSPYETPRRRPRLEEIQPRVRSAAKPPQPVPLPSEIDTASPTEPLASLPASAETPEQTSPVRQRRSHGIIGSGNTEIAIKQKVHKILPRHLSAFSFFHSLSYFRLHL
jgi:hypothetical protein